MSVDLYRVSYERIVSMGRYEANWLVNHVGASDDRQNMVTIERGRIEEYIQGAEECTGCDGFESNYDIAIHNKLTKSMCEILTDIFNKAEDNYVDISIAW